jgi:hypothetical protein
MERRRKGRRKRRRRRRRKGLIFDVDRHGYIDCFLREEEKYGGRRMIGG